MTDYGTFAAAILTKLVSVVAEHYATWLFHKIAEGADLSFDILRDLGQFLRRLVAMLSSQFCGRRNSYFSSDDEEQQWQPGYYGS